MKVQACEEVVKVLYIRESSRSRGQATSSQWIYIAQIKQIRVYVQATTYEFAIDLVTGV
jgi:hypothetical protein